MPSRRSSPARRGKIVVATFASSIYRMQIVVDLAAQFDRQVAFVGRGVIENSEIAQRLGLPADPGRRADSRQRRRAASRRRTSCASAPGRRASRRRRCRASPSTTTGTSGSSPDDVVVFSAREIPGNEKAIGRVMNHIARRGAEVVYEGIKHVHVSGHGSEEELKLMLSLVRPRYLRADTRGVPPARAACPGGGAGVPRHEGGAGGERRPHPFRRRRGPASPGKVPAGRILIDGTRSGEVGDEVLRDRRHLSGDGLVVPVVAIGRQSGTLEETPDVITRGFVLDARTEALLKEIPGTARGDDRERERRGADRSRADQGEDPRGSAAVLPEAIGPPAAGAAGDHGDLTGGIRAFAPSQRIRRRRAVRAGADLADRAGQLQPVGPGVVLQHRRGPAAGEFRRTGRRVPRRAVVPAARLRRLSHARWSSPSSAGTTSGAACSTRLHEGVGGGLLFACSAAFLSLVVRHAGSRPAEFRAGGYIGIAARRRCSPST